MHPLPGEEEGPLRRPGALTVILRAAVGLLGVLAEVPGAVEAGADWLSSVPRSLLCRHPTGQVKMAAATPAVVTGGEVALCAVATCSCGRSWSGEVRASLQRWT